MEKQLNISPVNFNETNHTYHLAGKELQGVTALINRQLFPCKYDRVDEQTLAEAAEYGNTIHAQIEMADTFGEATHLQAVRDYRNLIKIAGLERLTNEYLVSDEQRVASSIDIVFTDFSLADIKTTSQLDKTYLSWQLSIYAYLFEKQNPELHVPALYAIWLPKPQYGLPKLVPIMRRSEKEITDLLQADTEGLQYSPDTVAIADDLSQELMEIRKLKQELELREAAARERVKAALIENAYNSIKTENFTISYTPAGTTQKFDSKRFRTENKELYKSYCAPVETAERLTIKYN